MTSDPETPSIDARNERAEALLQRAAEIWRRLAGRDPEVLAADAGAVYTPGEDAGELALPVWGRMVRLTHPGFAAEVEDTGEPLDPFTTLLLAYYFDRADGTPGSGNLIAFSELPDATFYAQAFQSYTGAELGRAFGNDIEAFANAAAALGGRPEPIADRAFSFPVLPLVRVTVACWRGDQDFLSSYRVLFDAALARQLPTDVGAVLGSMITQRLIDAHRHPAQREVPRNVPHREASGGPHAGPGVCAAGSGSIRSRGGPERGVPLLP